jgi:hypothetical protein
VGSGGRRDARRNALYFLGSRNKNSHSWFDLGRVLDPVDSHKFGERYPVSQGDSVKGLSGLYDVVDPSISGACYKENLEKEKDETPPPLMTQP